MEKVTILSPVHIGTGKMIEPPSYKIDSNIATRYEFTELLTQIPYTYYENDAFFKQLSSEQRSKEFFYNKLYPMIDYTNITPKYIISYNLDKHIKDYPLDVAEQIKMLDKPYIPGSSIKGALINAWLYYVLKINYKQIASKLEYFLRKRKTPPILSLFFSEDGNERGKNLLIELASVVQCSDVVFNEMELYSSKRIGAGSECKGSLPLSYKECIKINENSYASFVSIHEEKFNIIKKNYSNDMEAMHIINQFSKKLILIALNEYTRDLLDAELEGLNKVVYADYPTISKQIIDLKKMMDLKKSEHCYFMRIGNSTNYFYKTISLLFKKKNYNLFEQYFDNTFSPTNFWKTLPHADSIPKTKVICQNNKGSVLPGFIMISYD